MQITQWPEAERPREKLLQRGPEALSDAELLAIFLRTGIKGCNAVDLSRLLIAEFGSLSLLLAAGKREFCQGKGLGTAKYVQLQAVMEMSRRTLAEQLQRESTMDSARAASDYVSSQLADERNEVFAVMMLDSQHRLIDFKRLFQGTINQASVYPRVIVQEAMTANAAAVILCHNHPSGVSEPSRSDIRITERIQKALALVDVTVLDHLVVAKGDVTSLAERGLM
ncbi:RadC family protein [Echinimonas agarilytica]|uniref:DNA repair protein RadC n=1 Tax=Echinimonas agarilytica TaxID=1215918 RepID=A0AA41W9P8_9GAMM|nr:DNA repair protein RadC [Echinimonas agarilytica]MCM2680938.1 DNA repair protein RadC [Echinimonas agarilytica]